MIDSKEKLKYYLAQDSRNYKSQTSGLWYRIKYNLYANPSSDQKYIWKYIKTLRYTEFYLNTRGGILHKLRLLFFLHKLRKLAYKTGFQIPPNTIGPGLTIWHWGPIIVNPNTKIGCNVVLSSGVLLGHKKEGAPAPTLGDNIFIGSGTKIIGDIKIMNGCILAQNCVVTDNLSEGTVVTVSKNRILK